MHERPWRPLKVLVSKAFRNGLAGQVHVRREDDHDQAVQDHEQDRDEDAVRAPSNASGPSSPVEPLPSSPVDKPMAVETIGTVEPLVAFTAAVVHGQAHGHARAARASSRPP